MTKAHIVAFCGQKGGTGKSGLAQAFAVEAARQSGVVIIADLDEGQRTSWEWGQVRIKNGLEPAVTVKSVSRLMVFQEAALCDVLVIDAPGWADDLSVWMAHHSHLMVLPSKPTVQDMNPTIRLIHELRKKGVEDYRSAIVLNEVLQDSEADFARKHLATQGLFALAGHLRTMKSYRDVGRVGKTLTETPSPSLNKEVLGVLDGIGKALTASEQQIANAKKTLVRLEVSGAGAKGRELGS
jgi:chromosome partitioning protein